MVGWLLPWLQLVWRVVVMVQVHGRKLHQELQNGLAVARLLGNAVP
jgi:hypothetical protein